MNILVTGGAGYVGSVVTEELLNEAHSTIVLDNLQQGHRQAVPPEAEFVLADICDIQALDDAFSQFKIDAVMHMAAETVVEFSITDPRRYFHSNVIGGINLLDTMLKHDVDKFIFSSSAAVYGEPDTTPIKEEDRKAPVNSYGESKLMFERILGWYGKAYGIQHISLRYFNAVGASERLGEDHRPETHLIPNILRTAAAKNGPVQIFGTDYPTRDGSCIRDYIHVKDVAKAHILALARLESLTGRVYNLGSGDGYSVIELINTASKVINADIPTEICPRRAGDPALLVASPGRAESELDWKPEFSELESIIGSAWKWITHHPNGYDK